MSQVLSTEIVNEIRDRVEALTPDERKALVRDLCAGVNDMAQVIVKNADAIREHAFGVASVSPAQSNERNEGGK